MLSQRRDNNAPELRRVVPDLFDRRPVGLVVKAAIVAAGVLVGTTVGFFLHELGPIIGAISGMVSALFVLAILACGVPWFRSTSPEQHMSLDKYRRIRRRFFRFGLLTYVWLLVGFVLGQVDLLVRGPPTIWFIIAWIVPSLTWGSLLMHNQCLPGQMALPRLWPSISNPRRNLLDTHTFVVIVAFQSTGKGINMGNNSSPICDESLMLGRLVDLSVCGNNG